MKKRGHRQQYLVSCAMASVCLHLLLFSTLELPKLDNQRTQDRISSVKVMVQPDLTDSEPKQETKAPIKSEEKPALQTKMPTLDPPPKIKPNMLIIDQARSKDETIPDKVTALGPQDRAFAREEVATVRTLKSSEPVATEPKEMTPDKAPSPQVEPAPPTPEVREKPTASETSNLERPTSKPPPRKLKTAPRLKRQAVKTTPPVKPEPVLDDDKSNKKRADGVNTLPKNTFVEAEKPPSRQTPKDDDRDNSKTLPSVDLLKAFSIDKDSYKKQFEDRDLAASDRLKKKPANFLGRWKTRSKQMKAAMENFAVNVRPGNQTKINTRRSVFAPYITRIHRRVHAQWAFKYLRHLDLHYPMGHPLKNPSLHATIEFVVDGKTGIIEGCHIFKGSNSLEYDLEAVRICMESSPLVPAPKEIISPDGKVYLHWNFWRNVRQCGTFGVSLHVLETTGRLDTYRVTRDLDNLSKQRNDPEDKREPGDYGGLKY